MNSKKEYYYGLDLFRTICMLIVIMIHVAAIVSPFYVWDYHSEVHENALIHNVLFSLNFICVEGFFMISGFFSAQVLAVKDKNYFLKSRISRVLVPLLSTVLFINTFEVWFIVKNHISDRSEIGFGNFLVHAWFLLTLLLLSFFCLLPVDKFFNRLQARSILFKAALFVFYIYLPFGIKFLLNLVIPMKDNPHFYSLYMYFIEKTLYYSIYFFIGYVIYRHESIRERLNTRTVKCVLQAVSLVGIGYLLWNLNQNKETLSFAMKAVNVFIRHISVIALCLLLFDFFYRLNFPEMKYTRPVVASSIVVYLFHHPVLIVSGYYLDTPAISAPAYAVLLILLAYFLPLAFYSVLGKSKITRFLFGLKP